MVNEWIIPIYDRNYSDVQDVQYDPTMQNPKGCYNAIDLNRIENNTAYCAEYMLEHKIIRVMPQITCKTNWNGNDIPTTTDMRRIIHNVMTLMELSNPMIFEDLPTLKIATQINFSLANDIERATNIARKMVTRWGMSDRLGPILYAEEEGEVFLGRSVTTHKNVSEERLDKIERTVSLGWAPLFNHFITASFLSP